MVSKALIREVASSARNAALPCRSLLWRAQSTATAASSINLEIGDDGNASNATCRRREPTKRPLKYLPTSPSSVIALHLKSRHGPHTRRTLNLFRDIAGSRSRRLPVMMFQHMVRMDDELKQTDLSECLADPVTWRERLNHLAFKGIHEEDIAHWVWIISAKDADTRIERFVSSDKPNPIFLLFQLLRRDEVFKSPRSLSSLMDYVAQHHTHWKTTLDTATLPWGERRRTLETRLNMTEVHFTMLLRLFVHHFLRIWPTALPSLARLVATYIERIQPAGKNPRDVYAARCLVFNFALQQFQRKSLRSPVEYMKYNWRAQKIMLALSARLPRPLIINKLSYKAIRRVILTLPKSASESKVAIRSTKSWPPYRQAWDGLDERRRPEDDLSRSFKAGTLAQASGYASDEHDRAVGVLGGAIIDESPTIQTRSLSPRTWTGQHVRLNVYPTWAARVKATRDAQEAWSMFQSAPTPGLKPNFQVYAEMFSKLLSFPVRPWSAHLPGDGREVFPIQDTNLSEFEKARLAPPSVKELYEAMLQGGNRPVQNCLAILVSNAPTLRIALQYLKDSGLEKKAIAVLHSPRELEIRGTAAHDVLGKVSVQIFDAYISLLCRLQARRNRSFVIRADRRTYGDEFWLLEHAISLTAMRLLPTTEVGARSPSSWHVILRTLAASQVSHAPSMRALEMFLSVFTRAKQTTGMDIVLFESLCTIIHNVTTPSNKNLNAMITASPVGTTSRPIPNEVQLLNKAHATLTASFRDITTSVRPDQPDDSLHRPTMSHDLQAYQLRGYVMALGYLGDTDEMVRVMHWMLDVWDDGSILENAKDPEHREHTRIRGAFVFFRAFAEPLISKEVMAQLEDKVRRLNEDKDCTWLWPTEEDVQEWIKSDRRENSDKFWQTARQSRKEEAIAAEEESSKLERMDGVWEKLKRPTSKRQIRDEFWERLKPSIKETKATTKAVSSF